MYSQSGYSETFHGFQSPSGWPLFGALKYVRGVLQITQNQNLNRCKVSW